MYLKNIKIGTQLLIGMSVIFIIIFLLSVVGYRQSEIMQKQTDLLHNQSFQSIKTIDDVKLNILHMRFCTRDLMLAKNSEEVNSCIERMNIASEKVKANFTKLYSCYDGPHVDIDTAYQSFVNWDVARGQNTRLALFGEIEKVKESVADNGLVGKYRGIMLKNIDKLESRCIVKADALYEASIVQKQKLSRHLLFLSLGALILMSLISIILLRNILSPVKALEEAISKYQQGDMTVRCNLNLTNEYGILADSFNEMIESINRNVSLTEKTMLLSFTMLHEEDSHKFFRNFLPELCKMTNSQVAAVYLLSPDKKKYTHYESVGLSSDALNHSFDAERLEGEFGSVLASRKIEYIKNIPFDTRFAYQTVSGRIVPRQIITIPILSGDEIIAIISLAGIRTHTPETIQLINSLYPTLNARIDGVLTFRKLNDFSKKLEQQNSELAIQKSEMATQASVLVEQNRELEMQKNQLREASRLKTNFLSNMSHELRTPLNSVIALSGVLSRRLAGKIPEDECSYLEVIERNGKQLLNLINEILDISRIESGKEQVEVSTFNVVDIISEVVSMIDPQAKQKGIVLAHALDNPEIIITSDADKCRHVLQNLISNAVKFTEKGQVKVNTVSKWNGIEIAVSDTGIGIEEEHIVHIFDEFRQADGSMSRRFGGTGLGLAIAKKYAVMLGGFISVKSIVGEGSTFTLTLPMNYKGQNCDMEPAAAMEFNSPSYELPVKPTEIKRILLVEDNEVAVIQLRDFLEESGYVTLVATNGAEALSIIEQATPDAMILDLMMPGLDGFQVLRAVREAEQTARMPVLILTAKHITREDVVLLKQNNVHQLIQKGNINKNELLNAVAAMVSTPPFLAVKTPSVSTRLTEEDERPVVLVVEDNPDNMTTIKALLSGKFMILEAENGLQGISMASVYKPDLILMDILLPDVDGIEAFKTIRKNADTADIPVVAITASAFASDKDVVLSNGFDSYLTKPIDEELFFCTINSILYGK